MCSVNMDELDTDAKVVVLHRDLERIDDRQTWIFRSIAGTFGLVIIQLLALVALILQQGGAA